MALPNPWHVPNTLGQSITTIPKPKPVVGPQNLGLPGYRPGDPGNPQGIAAAPVAPVAPPPPPPPDFNALTLVDPQYTTGKNLLDQQNTINQDALLRGFRTTAQGRQDEANSHGALFSGAAVNAQRGAAQDYERAGAQNTLGYQRDDATLKNNVFQRLIQQLAGGQ